MTEILESVTAMQLVKTELRIQVNDGIRYLFRDDKLLHEDGDDEMASIARMAIAIRKAFPKGASVGMLGCGFCILPRFFGPEFTFTVYEVEPSLQKFADECGAKFVPGDWRTTLSGTFDVVVYDIVGDRPDGLEKFLNPGGMIL